VTTPWFQQPAPIEEHEEAAQNHHDNQDVARQAVVEAKRTRARRLGEELAQEEEESLRRIVPVRGDTVVVSRTRWLWRDRVPLGGLSLLAGKGDVSKSTCFAQFVAWLTTGNMKGAYYGRPQDVAYVVNEDSMEQTVVPRMLAHGADMSRVHFLTVQSPTGRDALSLPRDSQRLTEFIRSTGVVCTFIDPLSANVTGRANDSRETRATYQEVNNIAEATMTTIWGLAHTRKAGAADIIEAILGSSEQGNVARAVHGLVLDPEEDGARILSCEKLNVGKKHILTSLRFTLLSVEVPCTDGTGEVTDMPQIHWLPETEESASDILADQLYGNSGADECATWALGYLARCGGEALKSDVASSPEGKKYSSSMLDRARKKAKIKSVRTKEVPSRTLWIHPDNDPPLHTHGVSDGSDVTEGGQGL
jgi:hypothetical protein